MILLSLLLACGTVTETKTETVTTTTTTATEVVVAATAAAGDCTQAKNVCPDYATSWVSACPAGSRCLVFSNASLTETVALSYEIGCNGDGTKGAPQCDCTQGPFLAPGATASFVVIDGDYASCLPSWQPACLTAGLAVIANKVAIGDPSYGPLCQGTRFEFTAGNTADPYGKFDSYDLDLEQGGYTVPVAVTPTLPPPGCANDSANHDCRPLVCDAAACPDAYITPTSGSCPDGRSPQVGCQDTFSDPAGLGITYYPLPIPKSCQDAVACGG
jgi:hypothetical protein